MATKHDLINMAIKKETSSDSSIYAFKIKDLQISAEMKKKFKNKFLTFSLI